MSKYNDYLILDTRLSHAYDKAKDGVKKAENENRSSKKHKY